MSNDNTEDRALEAIIASSLRSIETEFGTDDSLPKLNEDELSALDFGENFIDKIVCGDVCQSGKELENETILENDPAKQELVPERSFALNRATNVDEDAIRKKEEEIKSRFSGESPSDDE